MVDVEVVVAVVELVAVVAVEVVVVMAEEPTVSALVAVALEQTRKRPLIKIHH